MSTRTHRVVVLLVESALPMDVGIAAQIMRRRPGLDYELVMAGARAGLVEATEGFRFDVPHGLEALASADTVIVPGYEDIDRPVDPAMLAALVTAHARGVRVASICTGAFVLGAAGLLDGRTATTHWERSEAFRRRFPAVIVDEDVLFIDDGDILTSAGVAAGVDLCLHLIRRDHGVHAANRVAREIVAAPYRSGGQAQYVPRTLPSQVGESFALTREWALRRLPGHVTVSDMARHASVSYRTFSRRFVEDTGVTPLQWLMRARVDLAREMLEHSDVRIEQVAAAAGFGTAASLRMHFQRLLGTTPTKYRHDFTGRAHAGDDGERGRSRLLSERAVHAQTLVQRSSRSNEAKGIP